MLGTYQRLTRTTPKKTPALYKIIEHRRNFSLFSAADQAETPLDLSSSSSLSSPQACAPFDLSSSSSLSSPQACAPLDLSSSSSLSSPPQASRSALGMATWVGLSSGETVGALDQVKPVLIAKTAAKNTANFRFDFIYLSNIASCAFG